jgi:hypothetical protein
MDDSYAIAQAAMPLNFFVNPALVTVDYKAQSRIIPRSALDPGNHCSRAAVAPHGVDRNLWA